MKKLKRRNIMKTRKKIYKVIALMLALVFCLSAVSCRRENENENENTENEVLF